MQRFTPLLIDAARPCRHLAGDRWFVDETYVKVSGVWSYVYRAVDQHGQVIDVYVSQRRDIASVRMFFTAGMAVHGDPGEVITDRALLSLPLEELTGSVVPLRDVLGPSADEIVERFQTHSRWNARARILEAVMLRRTVDVSGVDRGIEWAWRRIVARHETVSIKELADDVGWSQRHFIRSFHRELGLTPHKLARITRLNAVLPELRGGRDNGASLAAKHGYADQSHLIREVREFTGATPTSLAMSGRA